MIIKETRHLGPIEVDVDTEIVIPSVDGMRTIFPFNPQWKRVLIQVSGGLDSALMLYLFAKELVQRNSQMQIQPLSFEVTSKAKTLATARAVIQKVRELTGYPHILPGKEIIIPLECSVPPKKDEFFKNTIYRLSETEPFDFEFNGITKNPPEAVRVHFRDDQSRQYSRDDRTTIYNARKSASPHAFNDKKGIVHLYKANGIVEELASLTLSCDEDWEVIQRLDLPVPCHECWWCRERAWGFLSNKVADPAINEAKA